MQHTATHCNTDAQAASGRATDARGWRRPIGCLKMQVSFCTRATNYRALLQKMTYTDKASYGSSPPCTNSCAYSISHVNVYMHTRTHTHTQAAAARATSNSTSHGVKSAALRTRMATGGQCFSRDGSELPPEFLSRV